MNYYEYETCVAPYVGAWIETKGLWPTVALMTSLPTWERGLKLSSVTSIYNSITVAPYVGAWIETYL